jgi:transposase
MTRQKHSRPARDIAPVHPHAAAVDIGATLHVAAVRLGCDPEPVRTFGTFTTDLHRLADWFEQCGVETVAMESTGVYWIPLYEILDQRGFEVVVVNARDAKHVPGRKTDVSDAAWLQRLHEYGLLRASFRPKGEIATLRSYLRQRERLLEGAAAHIQHMQKALTEMNLQLHHVVADVTGVTGLRILRALVAGERDPDTLAAYSDPRCKAPAETLRAALVGNYREEHVFALAQALELYDIYQAKVTACDQRIEAVLERLKAANPPPTAALPPARPRRRQANEPGFAVREALHAILGADPTQIDGIGPSLALTLVGECGTDLPAWPSAKHFTSWLSLAPHNKISGGKVLSARTRRSGSRAAALLRLAAVAVGRTATALGAFYRRLAARVGKAKAVTATARKIGVLFYNMLRHGMDYADPGASAYEARYRQRVLSNLRRRAKSLGYVLQKADPASAAIAVS